MQEFLTTKEVATYLRLKERRVYELVRQRAIPCTKVTGKWLFPKTLIDLWLAERVEGEGARGTQAPPILAGSHDPLLEWALAESACGLALLPGGSLDGLRRFAKGEALVAALHLLEPESGEYNVPAVAETFPGLGLVLIAWAKRRQGLILPAGNPAGVETLADLAARRLRVVCRQEEAGSQILLLHLLEKANLGLEDLELSAGTAHNETEVGLAVLEGRADCGLAVESVARSLQLTFLPLAEERLDLLLRRRDYFETPFQALLTFARTPAFQGKAKQLGGYDLSDFGSVRYNGP